MGNLQLMFTGICAFTPGAPATSATTATGPLTFVMPSSTTRRSKVDPSVTIPQHVPFLIARIDDIDTSDPSSRPPDLVIDGNPDGHPRAVWVFSRERLTFSDDTAGTIDFDRSGVVDDVRPQPDDRENVHWISDMREIWPDVATIRATCLPETLPVDPNVTLQVVLGSGSVMSWFNEEKFTVVHFEPVKDQQVRQTITRLARVERPLPSAATLTIESTSLDSGDSLGEIRLHVPSGSDLELMIGNTSLRDIEPLARGESPQKPAGPDLHFELYYEVLSNVPADPSQLVIPVDEGVAEGSHSNCPVLMTT